MMSNRMMADRVGPAEPKRASVPSGRGRKIASVLALILLLIVGGGLLAAGLAQQAVGGYFGTPKARLATATSALVTREIDVDARKPADTKFDVGDLSRVRIRANSNGSAPLFIGIGRVDDVLAYLRASSYDEMASYQMNPLRVSYTRSAGHERPAAPTAQTFWVASASGSGPLDLQWNKRGGAWMAVAMNADGSPSVAFAGDIGLRFGFLLPLGVAVLVADLALLCCLLLLRARSRRSRSELTPARIPPALERR